MLPFWRKRNFADVIKDFEMRGSSWIIWVEPKHAPKCSQKKEAKRDLITQRRRPRDGNRKQGEREKMLHCWLSRWMKRR